MSVRRIAQGFDQTFIATETNNMHNAGNGHDDVDIPDPILWDLAGGNFDGPTATESLNTDLEYVGERGDDASRSGLIGSMDRSELDNRAAASGDEDDDDLANTNIWNLDGGKVAGGFNQDLGGWDTSSVTNMGEMFAIAEAATGGLPDIMVRDDDDDSAAGDDDNSDLPDIMIWDLDGGNVVDHRVDGHADQFVFVKNDPDPIIPSADDTIYGTYEDDLLVGSDTDDVIAGKYGNDILSGKEGNDKLFGQQGNDTLIGGDGYDILEGGIGNDVLYGDEGQDYLIGGSGNDVLTGGSGGDHFLFVQHQSSVGIDIITDYEIGFDDLWFTSYFLDIAPGETLQQNLIALEAIGGAELWADVADVGLTQIAFVEDLTMQQLQFEIENTASLFL